MIRTKLASLLVTAFAVAALAIPANADAIVVKHRQGETTLAAIPAKVIVFDMASLDTLDALGVEVAGVPGGRKPEYLKAYEGEKYAKVGTLFEPDYEAVSAAAPDLIVIGGRSAAKYAELSRIAPTIDLSVDAKAFKASAEENVRTLGALFGKSPEAETLIGKLESSASALKEKAQGAGNGLLILTTGGKMSAYGPGSRFGVLHDDYGVVPAAADLKPGKSSNHGQAISFEFILETDPDWLFVIDRDAAIGREGTAAAAFLDNEIVRQTKAWKNGHVVYLDAASWYVVGGGIQSMQRTVDQLTTAFAGE